MAGERKSSRKGKESFRRDGKITFDHVHRVTFYSIIFVHLLNWH